MAKPKMQTITRKDWDKKHKDFKLIGKDKIPYIMVYDNGTKLIPVKIIEGEIEESVASAIDQIRQDSKDIRDFLKKVFSDSDFRAMKNDKDFVQYLKSIYEGVSVNERNSSVNKRRAGAELKQKLKGKRSDGMGKYTATIYGLDSKGKRVELKSLNDLNKYSKFELDESVNEGLKHNDMYTMLDIAAGYSSTQDQAANQMWSDEQDLYDYLKSDHIPKKYHKKFYNDIKRRFKGVNESINEARSKKVTKQMWAKMDDDKKIDALLSVVKDPDDAEKYFDKKWNELPSGFERDMVIYELVNEAKEPEVIVQLRKIVKDSQNDLIKDTKSGKKVRVDMGSANLIVQVYDALKKQSNKDKFVKSGIAMMGHTAYKLMKKEDVSESGIMYKAGVKKYGKEGMTKIQSAAGKGEGHEEIGKIKDKYDKSKNESVKPLKTSASFSEVIQEAEYQGRKVELNKPMQGDTKKFKVYVKNDKGNVVKVNFGQKGMVIKKDNPGARKSFRARMNCDTPGPKWKARYWSCKKW